MSIPELALRYKRLTWFLLLVFALGGVWGFLELGKREDSTFVIKSASIVCSYPGASPIEVEQLITEPIEREIQTIRRRYKITSDSQYGLSKIMIELDPATPPEEIPQLWDELRRKVLNVQPQLPEGASTIIINDDFGDVYGIYYALAASEGFSFGELRDWSQRIKRDMLTIDGVQKVSLFGEQRPVVNLYVSLSQLSNFSIRPETIVQTIARQNKVISSGEQQAGQIAVRILEQGSYSSLRDISEQLLVSSDGKQFRLGDIARVERGYMQPMQSLMRVDGERAIGIGISTDGERDVVAIGEVIEEHLAQIERDMPLGLSLKVLYPENEIAREATNTFLMNLMESLVIVIFVIMLLMGFRAGVLIGSSLIFSIGATLLLMLFVGEGLNRTSLAGFIIAMGMLVDNAIVVSDNSMYGLRRGEGLREAVVRGADAPKWSLLGATLIAIFSFLPLYLAPSAVAEIVKPLFVVLAISLMMSWFLALTQTPLFAMFLLKKPAPEQTMSDEQQYDTPFYRGFDKVLALFLRRRWWVVASAVALLFGSLTLMGSLPQDFFPSLDKPYFRADLILPEGYNIEASEERLERIEAWLLEQEEVKRVSITAGGTPPRYYLASSSVSMMPNFSNVLVELHLADQSAEMEERFNRYVRDNYPDVWCRSSLFKLSPVPDAAIEMGFIGESVDTLLRLTRQVEQMMWRNPRAVNVRNSWGNEVPTWQPIYSQMKGGRIGVSRSDLSQGIMVATTGYQLGTYREGDQTLPMLMKDLNIENYKLTNIETMPIFSPSGKLYAVEQATSGFAFEYEKPVIKRFNRNRVMKAQCDPARGVNTKQLYLEIADSVATYVTLPKGYLFKVFGEEETQAESNEALAENFPLTLVLMFITLLLLFNSYREPLLILMLIPFIMIGVALGLWVSGFLFNFFALLGVLGLIGMNIKNGVVLISRIAELRAGGVDDGLAIIQATRSRILPVAMASGTTILGMIPLLFDSLFAAMAVTIMGGLVAATLLTVCLLPVGYAILYNVKIK